MALPLEPRGWLSDMNEDDTRATEPPQRAVIKRRWAIVRKAGGGAAVLAIAGAIALGDPNDTTDYGQDGVGNDSQISAES